MVTSELGACEWFVWDLRRSNLLDRGQLDQIVGDYLQKNPRAEPPALAEFLIDKSILTKFQAERLLQGKTQGFVLGPFTLMDALGAGSMGTVYKAQSKTDNQWYAVKVLPRRSMWNVRIARRKVRAFEQVRHPAVIPFVDVGTAGGMHYLSWPYIEGLTLDKYVEHHGKLTSGQVAALALQIAEGLDAAHQQQLFHGLLKPSNLMIAGDESIKILDFGIGSLLAETEGESLVDTMSTANSVTSGLDCSSPESIMDPTNLTPAGDQYSLGCVLYFMLTAQVPFPDGNAAEKMMAHQFKQPTPIQELNPEVPSALVAIVERLMQKTPGNRYANVAEAAEELRPLAAAFRPKSRSGIRPLSVQNASGPGGMRSPGSAPGFGPKPGSAPGFGPKPGSAPGFGQRPPGSSPGFAPSTVAPSTPTPKPQAMGSLPSRDNMKAPPPPGPRPKTMLAFAQPQAPVPPVEEEIKLGESRIIPGGVDETPIPTLEERMGPLGIVVTTIAACVAVYFLAAWFGLFR